MKFERKSIRRFKRVESSKVASSRGAAQTIQWNLKSHSLQLLELPQFSNSIQLFSWSHFLCQVSQVWNSIWGKECGSNKYYLVSCDINSIEISIQHLVTLVKKHLFWKYQWYQTWGKWKSPNQNCFLWNHLGCYLPKSIWKVFWYWALV